MAQRPIVYPVGQPIEFQDTVSMTGTASLPSGTVTNAMVTSTAADAIDGSKLKCYFTIPYHQVSGTDVATESHVVFIARATGTLIDVEVVPETAPTGGDKQYTVDVHNGDASTAFATVLSSVVTVNTSSADRTIQTATISSSAIADGDQLKVVVTASGSTGSQGQGLCVALKIEEEPS